MMLILVMTGVLWLLTWVAFCLALTPQPDQVKRWAAEATCFILFILSLIGTVICASVGLASMGLAG